MKMVHETKMGLHERKDHRRKAQLRMRAYRRGMLAQLEKTFNVSLVLLVPSVSLVGENVNLDNLTNHLKDPRSILATLLSGHRAHNNLFPNEVKYTKLSSIQSHPHKHFFGNIGDIVVVTYLRSEGILKELIQHPIDEFHARSSLKLNLAIGGVVHKCHLTVKWYLSTMKLWATKIFFTKLKNLSQWNVLASHWTWRLA
jgi:hypothetical protein